MVTGHITPLGGGYNKHPGKFLVSCISQAMRSATSSLGLGAVQRLIILQEEMSPYGLGNTVLEFLRKFWFATGVGWSIGHENKEERQHHGSPSSESAKVLCRAEGDNESDDEY